MSTSTSSFYGPRIEPHTRLIEAISHMSEDGERDIVVIGPSAGRGGDRSDTEGMSDEESESQMPEEIACVMETMHRELEELSNPETEKI